MLLIVKLLVKDGQEGHLLAVDLARCPTLSGRILGKDNGAYVAVWMSERDRPNQVVGVDIEAAFYFEGLEPGAGRLIALEDFNPKEHGGADFWRNAWTRGSAATLEEGDDH